MTMGDLLVAIAILVGLIGIVVPVLPGSVLILGAVLAWAVMTGTPAAWVVFAVATTFLMVGAVVKYTVPGRRLRSTGVPTRSLVAGGVLGVVGFFVIPVVGLFLGFVAGVYLAETVRVGSSRSLASTKSALGAVGLSMLIELAAAMLAALTWAAGAVLV